MKTLRPTYINKQGNTTNLNVQYLLYFTVLWLSLYVCTHSYCIVCHLRLSLYVRSYCIVWYLRLSLYVYTYTHVRTYIVIVLYRI